MIKNREDIIKEYCKAAEFYFLQPWTLAKSEEEFKKHNITKDDFVKILSEDLYEAMVIGCENWKPKFELTNQEYMEVLKREERKLELWKKISNIRAGYIKEGLIKDIEERKINSWEELERSLNNISLIDR